MPVPGRLCGTWSREKQIAATANVVASTAIAQPGPTAATRTPPRLKPTTAVLVCSRPRNATAEPRSSAGTVRRVIAAEEGWLSAPRHPLTAPITASVGIVAHPPISSAATRPCVIVHAAAEPSIMILRDTRSPSTPPSSTVTTSASANAPTTTPRSVGDPPRSSTANARATGVMALPRLLVAVPATSHRKSRWRRGARRSVGASRLHSRHPGDPLRHRTGRQRS